MHHSSEDRAWMRACSNRHRLAVLMACHNRRATTIGCLRALQEAADSTPGLQTSLFLTDDGSTDGTAKAAMGLGFDITVVQGSGNLFWNRGMVLAWQAACADTTAFDAFLLLNDDTALDTRALRCLLETSADYRHEAIVVGATRDPQTGVSTYGGVRRTSRWHPGRVERLPVSETVQEADTFNANCVLVPRRVYEKIGMLDPTFHHSIGDFDYGLRALAAGIQVVVAPGTIGTCARNAQSGTWMDPKVPIRRRLELLESPKGLPRREWLVYLRRHGALLPWLLAWAPTIRALWPHTRSRRPPGNGAEIGRTQQ